MKEIANVVIYTTIENGNEIMKSCIFYSDGSIKTGDSIEGRVAIRELAKQKNITSADQLRAIRNKEYFFTLSEEEFQKRFNSFIPTTAQKEENTTLVPAEKDEVVYEEEYGHEYTDFTTQEEEEEENDKNTGCLQVVVGTIVVGLIVGGTAYALTRCSKMGKVLTDNTNTITTTTNTNGVENKINDNTNTVVHNNDLYNDYTFAELLDVTTNEFQKNSMIKVASGLTGFNSVFAKNYLESGHDIRAALTFDEVVALQQAYNNYTVDELRSYFNGYEVDAVYMSNAYKSASLQLMGAYAIETSEHPVDMSILIDSQEGRDFYNRYHAMYLAAKEAKGEEQIRLVKEFYAAVEKDFPISEEVRTTGISHSEDHNSLKDYQLAVAPMIASAEMIFQNLNVDYTLDDTKVDFLNDIGLCNHADDKFERLETITLSAYEDNTNPLYEQYKNAIIRELVKDNEYVIDDAHRELSKLRRFQEVVNHDPLNNYKSTYEGYYGESYTDYETYTWEETTTEYETVVTTEELPIPEDEKKKIDDQIEQENEEAKRRAEEEAEAERKRQQEEEDKKAKDIEEEIKEDEKQLQEDIDDINKTINDNNKDDDKSNDKPVNENDYDNIDFDDEYTDDKGNLDSSVENVTTDGSGANEDLPDPNVTGASFDSKSTQSNDTTTTYTTEDTEAVYVEYTGVEGAYIEYDMEYPSFDADGNPITTEEPVNQRTR